MMQTLADAVSEALHRAPETFAIFVPIIGKGADPFGAEGGHEKT